MLPKPCLTFLPSLALSLSKNLVWKCQKSPQPVPVEGHFVPTSVVNAFWQWHFAWSSKRFQAEPLSRFPMLSPPQRTAFGISVTSHTRPSSGDVREAGWPWRWEDWLFPGYKYCITIIANLIILLWKWRPEIVETSHFYRLFFFENVFFSKSSVIRR